ncbi:MAG: PKD-like domain-containing protein [Ferruginibacter sp.]
MKKVIFLLLALLPFATVLSQSTANYAFSTNTSGTLTDMSAGTTQLVAASTDDGASAVTNIGFDFWFMGTRYTQFSVNSNGLMQLGSTAVGTSTNVQIGGTATTAYISAFSFDQKTGSAGKVHYKLIGTAPNRQLVIEWLNMAIGWNATTTDDVYQVILSETSGIISFIYGNMVYRYAPGTTTVSIGIQSSNTNNTYATINENTNVVTTTGGTTNYDLGTTVPVNMQVHSTVEGTRRVYNFTPAIPSAPTGLNFTGINTSTMTLNWTDNASNEVGYAIYRSTDGINYTFVSQTAANAVSSLQGGLAPLTLYYWRVYAVSEGGVSTPVSGSSSTTACGGISGVIPVGPTGTYPTITAALAAAGGGLSGSVIFELQPTYTSGGETYPITFLANGCVTPAQTITVRPQTGATGLTISSSNTTATIDLNGAKYFTIDGRPGGLGTTSQLTITNTSTTSGAAIRFINDASNNTITYCALQGSATAAANGVVLFSSGTTTGNDNNTLSNNNIGPAGANLPLNGIYSVGTSAVVDNSGNTVTANNIFDYFNAASATSGMNINTGNSGWVITNNRLYQTANRLYTSANTHNGINITSGSGYTITGNIIGYANSTGTGTTNMVGNSVNLTGTFPSSYTTTGTANATRYVAINAAFTAGGAVSSIQNNTIAGFALYTSSGATTANGVFCGIAVTSGAANIGTVTGNTIGATSGTGSIYTAATTNGGMIAGIYVTSSDPINIQNNTIGALDAMGTTATLSGSINGINVAGTSTSYTINNNIVGNSTNPNLRTGNLTTGANLSNVGTTFGVASGSVTCVGILSSLTSAGNIGTVAQPNIIRNMSINASGASTSVRGITASGSPLIVGNQINNITSASTNTGVASTLLAEMGIFLNSISTNGAVVSRNVINSLSLNNTTTSGTNLAAIAVYAGTTEISYNRIYDLSNASTSTTTTTPGTASAIFMRQPAGTQSVFNNMISLGNGQTANTSFNGIWQQNSAVAYTLNCYFNSINIEGTAASGAQPSFCLNRGSYTTTTVTITEDIRNNIFTNTRSGGTGKHYAIANNYGATATATGWPANASNYNILNAAAATVGYWTTDQTFAAWKTSSSCDGNSQSGVTITYTNTATGDLHISGIPTPIESAGTVIATVTDDYDGQIRANFSPTDIGADADNFFNYPVITYTPLTSNCVTTARTLVATITDPDGVPTVGAGLPVLYWKVNAGAYSPAVATYLGSNQYQFTFGGGTAIGDVISYYIAAQDNLLNVGTSPSLGAAGFTANPPAAATPPTTPNTYSVLPTLSGTYTVGVGGNYTTLTAAINAYNNSCLGGPVVFSLTDATYPSETFPLTINANFSASAINTLTIKPATGVTPTISGLAATTVIFRYVGADYVTIDGSNTAGGTTKDLTIKSINTTTSGAPVFWIGSQGVGAGATNNTIKNCNIQGGTVGSSTLVTFGIFLGDATGAANGSDNDNFTVQNNAISNCYYGIQAFGGAVSPDDDNLVITNNTIGTGTPATSIGSYGILVGQQTNATITGNTVNNVGSNTATTQTIGIGLGSACNGVNISQNTISNVVTNGSVSGTGSNTGIYIGANAANVVVNRNKITGVVNTSTGGWGARALIINTGLAASNLTVSNNMISDVYSYSDASASFWPIGIDIDGTSGGVNIFNNSVNLFGSHTGLTSASGSAAMYINTSGTNIDIRNNIFSSSYDNATSTTDKNYAIYSSGTSGAQFSTIDYNDYYVTGASTVLGSINATDRLTLAAIQAGFGGNANSRNVAPVYTSSTDLHLSNAVGANWCLNGTGITIPAITNDFDGDLRNNPPDIGADEFIAAGDAVATPASQTICSGSAITTIVLSGTASSYSWTRDNTGSVTGIAGSGTGNISGSLTNTTTAPITVTFTISPVDAGGCSGPSITATVVVNPTPNAVAAPSSQTICSASAISTITLSGAVAGTTFSWTRDNTGTVTGIAGSGAGDISGSLTNTTNIPVTVTFTITPTANGCPGTPTTATVLVNPTPNAVANPASQTKCSGSPITTIVLTSAVSGTTYNWTRDNTVSVTGIASSGAGDISGTLTNTTNAPITVTFTITPTANGCPGAPITATVLVNPTPNATAIPATQTVCSGSAITTIVLSSTTAGTTTYSWTRDNTATATGMAASGSGNISGTLTNTTNAPVTVTFTITPSNSGCSGTPITATVTVDPIPDVNQPANQVVCNNSATTPVTFTGSVAGTIFNWTNSNTAIGLAASGTGNIPSFTATNATNAPITGTITVTPTFTSGFTSQTFNYTGGVQTFTVPPGVTSLNITCFGAQGENAAIGGTGGKGASATGTLAVTPGQVLNIYVGGAGNGGIGGFNGGGNGGAMGNTFFGGTTPGNGPAGGGASDIRVGGTALANRVLVAGGGGGAGANGDWPGCQPAGPAGNGGDAGLVGSDGTGGVGVNACNCGDGGGDKGTGGTNLAGGNAGGYRGSTNCLRANWTIGANGASGNGGNGSAVYFNGTGGGGGGGGGYFGGGSGGNGSDTSPGGGGGGGSSYTGGVSSGSVTGGVRTGDGMIVISFVGGTPCTGTPKTFTYTVNPTATVNAVANQAVCSGGTTAPVNFSSPTTGGTIVYNWTNNQPGIGLAASGTGDIPSFTATNAGAAPIVATITVTPSYTNGVTCAGTPMTFTITVNPLPALSATFTQPSTCVAADGAINLNIASPAGPYTFAWTGTGVNPTSQNQTGLTIGTYNVTVTVNATGCQSSASYNLVGPGGCSICPTIPSFSSTPNIACSGQPVTLSTSGMTNMGISYGVIFKYSATPLADPYTGGTTIATIPNGGLTSGGTAASTSTSFATAGTYYVYAILTPTPIDPACRPFGSKTLQVEQTPSLAPVANLTYCNSTPTAIIVFGASPGISVNWTNSNTAIGLAASGSGNIPSFVTSNATTAPITATITATPFSANCTGTPVTFTITVNPTATVNAVANQTLCAGTATTAVNFSSPTTGGTLSYGWTNSNTLIGLPASGTGNIASFTAANPTNAPITSTITVTPYFTNGGVTCAGTARSFTITVNPVPTVNAVANQTVCNGATTAAVTFTGAVPGTVYNWTNNNTAIGLGASGTGNIGAFTATNATTAPITATITVTPSYTSGAVTCTGTPRTFTITVNPTAVMNTPANVTVCNNAVAGPINFTSANTGGTITYAWTNSNTSIGLASGGIGNIGAFTALNATNAPVTATITVTPTFTNGGVSCTGNAVTFTITVNPTPVANPPLPGNQVLCNGSNTAAVTFTSSQAGVFFQWTNNQPSIGLAGAGVGNIPSFTAINTGTSPVTATVTVTPVSATGCPGVPVTFTITVNPTPAVNAIASQSVCNGATVAAITPAGPVAGTVYTWTNNNTSIGLSSGGTGTIPGFTAVNNTSAPVTATITVTPNYSNAGVSCAGTPVTYTITVNPTGSVNAVGNKVLCNGAATGAINFSSAVAGTTFAWTNSNTSIGLAASGTGNIASFTATNATSAPITATITVTPTAGTCGGTAMSFTITVNPTASVNAIANQTVCNGSTTAAVTPTSSVAGVVFNWTIDNPSIGVGLVPGGTGSFPSFTAINTTNSPITATVTYTATLISGGATCAGPARTFTITVNPSPNVVFTNMPPRVCLTDTVVVLNATPAGGVWSGRGVVNNTFNARLAGLGASTITYTYTNSSGCTNAVNATIVVNDCIERHNVFATAIRIYPNPNNGRFNIRFLSDVYKEFNVRIVAADGKVMKEYHFTGLLYGSVIPMNETNLPSGTYFLEVYNTQEKASFPFVIAR